MWSVVEAALIVGGSSVERARWMVATNSLEGPGGMLTRRTVILATWILLRPGTGASIANAVVDKVTAPAGDWLNGEVRVGTMTGTGCRLVALEGRVIIIFSFVFHFLK